METSSNALFNVEGNKIPKLNFPQELLLRESIEAIKNSTRFQNFENFKKKLIEDLPQNSIETRKRNASYVIRRYFSDNHLQSLCPLIWKHYQNEEILKDIMRYQFMKKENLISYFFLNYLIQNEIFNAEIFRKFSIDLYGEAKKKLVERLSIILRGMDYIYYDRKNKVYVLLKPSSPKTSFLILLHYLFSQQPKTTTVAEILENPFWKYIRIYSQSDVREILKKANAENILSKYIIADTLEQITTKYSFLEFIEKKIKL